MSRLRAEAIFTSGVLLQLVEGEVKRGGKKNYEKIFIKNITIIYMH